MGKSVVANKVLQLPLQLPGPWGEGGGRDRGILRSQSISKMPSPVPPGSRGPAGNLPLQSELVQILIPQPEFRLLAPKTCFVGPRAEPSCYFCYFWNT